MSARILLADDSQIVRRSLHGLLEKHPNWEVCAEAVDGTDLIDKARRFKPDIIVVDFVMPSMTGLEAARVLGRVLPSIPILLFALDVTTQLVEQAKNVGIKGAVQKSDTRGMVSGVEALLRKKTFFDKKHN
jgi:DNA-binding NarL/FixJ family response regulator